MKKPFRHIGVLMLMSIAALGLIAAAYTLWYEDLSLTADVSTAELDVDWDPGTVTETVAILSTAITTEAGQNAIAWSNFTDFGTNTTIAPNAKYIQSCSSAVTTTAGNANGNSGSNNDLTLTADDLYPFAGCKFQASIEAVGNVPVHLTMTATNADPGVRVLADPAGAAACRQIAALLSAETTVDEIYSNWNGTSGTTLLQLHATESLSCTFLVYLEEIESGTTVVDEGADYEVSGTLKAHQFNEPAS